MRSLHCLFSLLVVLALVSVLEAGEPSEDYSFVAGEREGFIEDTVVLPFFMGIRADAINGYSWGACHDPLVSVVEEGVAEGAALEDIEFELHVIEIYEDGWSVDALFSEDTTLDGVELEMYEVEYELLDDGLAFVEYCDVLADGDAEIPVQVIVGEDTFEPLTREGVIEVLVPEEKADYHLFIGKAETESGEAATLSFFTSVFGDPINGWSWGACHDERLFIDSEESIAPGEGNFELDFDFEIIEVRDFGWTAEALLAGDDALDGEEVELYAVTYETEDDGKAWVEFCDQLGDPEVGVFVVVGDDEVEPATEPGFVFIIGDEPPPGEDDDLFLIATHERGFVGGDLTASVFLFNDVGPVDGYQFGLCHGERVAVEDEESIAAGDAIAELEPAFSAVSVFDFGWNVGVVFDLEAEDLLGTGEELQLYEATYELLEEGEAGLEFCAEELEPERLSVIIEGKDFEPGTEDGGIEILGAAGFKRGDANGNGEVFPLEDAIFLFRFGFLDEQPAPPCMDAADSDDDGEVEIIGDALFVLNWGFNEDDEPPLPGPFECGEDPAEPEDELDCSEVSEECI